MEAVLPTAAIKPFGKILQTLNKVGEDLYILARPNKLVLSTVNASRSAFVSATLHTGFFEQYTAKKRGPGTEGAGPIHCHVLIKPLLNIFRPQSGPTPIESCRISLPTTISSHVDRDRMIITVSCSHSITKTHKLHFASTEPIMAIYAKHACANKWTISSRLSHDWISCFSHRLEEITISSGPDWLRLKSFSESTDFDEPTRGLQTELQVDPSDFDVYAVTNEEHLTINLKEFKTVLAFADTMVQPITTYYDTAGRLVTRKVMSQ
ncbi:Rad9/Ddc1 [Phlyctochytrium arcticum]|nr:Rad9/Ddc1 [Phlyctochytrium arcticum]